MEPELSDGSVSDLEASGLDLNSEVSDLESEPAAEQLEVDPIQDILDESEPSQLEVHGWSRNRLKLLRLKQICI